MKIFFKSIFFLNPQSRIRSRDLLHGSLVSYPLDHEAWWKKWPILVFIFYSYEKPSDTWKKLPPLKSILALPTMGQKRTAIFPQPFEIAKFQTKHPFVIGWTCLRVLLMSVHLLNTSKVQENHVKVCSMNNDTNLVKVCAMFNVCVGVWFPLDVQGMMFKSVLCIGFWPIAHGSTTIFKRVWI